MSQNQYVYVFVRSDLSHAQIVVQTSHAAIEAARQGLIPADRPHPHLVVLGVRDENKLIQIQSKLEAAGIRFRSFIEPDIGNQLTAIATEPISGERRKFFKNYQLLQCECKEAA